MQNSGKCGLDPIHSIHFKVFHLKGPVKRQEHILLKVKEEAKKRSPGELKAPGAQNLTAICVVREVREL
ncbi:hypothetical protein HYALB_00001914 [Hymenoscyphus albidus]|uniref:Uncharacterized protein n=1 Tax=Hymenoscyphus albidus TaxID=595503 RepID=A0A9N9Q1L6_9HELO|nr:hypothetical protein HYALB_00001914 [Hymenoscyphus albidus]